MSLCNFLCNVKGKDWEAHVAAMSAGQAKSIYLHDIQEAWPDVPYTSIVARRLAGPPANKAEELQRQCDSWNEPHPIGTTVAYHPVIGEPDCRLRKTQTGAYVLSGHTAVLFLRGETGCVALDAVAPMPTGGPK